MFGSLGVILEEKLALKNFEISVPFIPSDCCIISQFDTTLRKPLLTRGATLETLR